MRRGFFILEAVVGMVLLAMVAGSMLLLLRGSNDVKVRMRERQRALQKADAALIALQNHRAPPRVLVVPAGEAQGHLVWVRVTADAGEQKAELYGLVPSESQ